MFAGGFAGFGDQLTGEAVPAGGVPALASLPSAPQAPIATSTIATTSRGLSFTSAPILPTSLGALVAGTVVPVGFVSFLENLGATEDTAPELFYMVAETDFMDALGNIGSEGNELTAIQRAALVISIREFFEKGGRAAPRLGTSSFSPPALPLPPVPSSTLCLPSSSSVQAVAPETVNLSTVIDQGIKGNTCTLSFSELAECRARFARTVGCDPPEEHRPSGDQVAGLRSLLFSGRVPYVDFSVWNHLGARTQRFRRTEASVFIGGELVTKLIEGSSTFESWCDSRALYTTAMISFGAAAPGTLNTYASGMKALVRLFPARWPVIMATDIVVRTERWTRIREDAEITRPINFNPLLPWDFVIYSSAYGADGPNSAWWTANLILPLTLGQSPPSMQGVPSKTSSSSLAVSSKVAGTKRKAEPRDDSGHGSEVCTTWNARAGKCRGNRPCYFGRLHVCSVCGGAHRACDYHGNDAPSSSSSHHGKAKGKGKGKKNGNHKNDGDKKADNER